MFQVQASPCSTCIYRKDSGLDIKKLEADVADKFGGFKGHRECHHAPRGSQICCRGFWNRHKDKFQMGQIAQRLKAVLFVTAEKENLMAQDQFEYINQTYGLTIRKNSPVEDKKGKRGQVVKARGQYIYIQWDGEAKPMGPYHPVDNLKHI